MERLPSRAAGGREALPRARKRAVTGARAQRTRPREKPQQIADELRRLIVSGELSEGDSLGHERVDVNGFDELYDGPGCGEDTDIEYRLSLLGVSGVSLRNLAIQYHVYHPLTKTSQACWDRFHKMVKGSIDPRCSVGLVKEPSG